MNKNSRLMISPTASTSDLSGLDDYFIRITTPIDTKAPSLATFACDRLGLKTIAVVYDLSNPSYTLSLSRYFKQELEKLGGRLPIMIPFDPRKNFSAPEIAQKIVSAGTDGVFLITNAIHAGVIAQHLRKAGSEAKIIVSQWGFPDPAFIQNGGRAVEGAVSLAEFNAESTDKRFVKLKHDYERRFSMPIGSASQRGYEAAQILFSALRQTDDPGKLKEAVLDGTIFKSVDGNPIVLDKFGDSVRTLFVLEIRDGKIRTIGKVVPSRLEK
jgi:branched-chain amino acid transport system substrate-binding protein